MNEITEFFGEPIHVYTTTQAIADGVLVDAGPMARDHFKWPVLLTAAAWEDCVAWTEADTDRTGSWGQSQEGRLHDVLWMTRCAIRSQVVQLYRVARDSAPGSEAELVTLKATGTFHDDGTPLLVISFPEED